MDSHLAALGLSPGLWFANRLAHNLHLAPTRLESESDFVSELCFGAKF